MRALVQRVADASVTVDDEVIGSIGRGLCVLVGVTHDDDVATADRMADRLAKLRVFGDDDGKMNRSVVDVAGEVLIVSQFTLYGDTTRGNRPGYGDAARPEVAEPLIGRVAAGLRDRWELPVATGRFGAHMDVRLLNEGPVTLLLEL